MIKKLSLSIVIPVYNEEHHLRACLEAIAYQSEKPEEVIVVDNNSTDNTVQIANEFPFVTLIHEKKQGVLAARTTGFNAVNSDIIGRIDADTILSHTWVARAKHNFLNPKVAAVTGSGYWYDMPLGPSNYHFEHFFKSLINKYLKDSPFLFGTNMAMRRTTWQKIKPKLCSKDTSIHEDLDIAIHLFQNRYKIHYDKYLRIGMSSRRYDDKARDFFKYMMAFRLTYQKHGFSAAASRVAIPAYTTGYVLLWPLRRSYNPKTKQFSLTHLLKGGNEPRKSPVTH